MKTQVPADTMTKINQLYETPVTATLKPGNSQNKYNHFMSMLKKILYSYTAHY